LSSSGSFRGQALRPCLGFGLGRGSRPRLLGLGQLGGESGLALGDLVGEVAIEGSQSGRLGQRSVQPSISRDGDLLTLG